MKKKIFLLVLIIVLSSVTALAVWQWGNIVAVVDGIRYDDEQIAQKASTSAEKIDKYFEENQLNKVTPMTPEQEEALQKGEITADEAIKIMTGEMSFEEAKSNVRENENNSEDISAKESTDNESSDDGKPEVKLDTGSAGVDDDVPDAEVSGNDSKPSPSTDDISANGDTDVSNHSGDATQSDKSETVQPNSGVNYDSQISATVAKLYVVKSNFYAEFNSKYNAARSAFLARPASERTKANLAATVRSYMSEGLAMERECDAQVDAILSELSGLLRSAGRDQSLVDSIRSAYDSEKSALKSRLINKYF